MTDVELPESGGRVCVGTGDRVTLRLAENPATGYRWALSAISGVIEAESSEFHPGASARPGAGGERVIVLRATQRGDGVAEFILVRSWQPDQPVERRRVEVVVT